MAEDIVIPVAFEPAVITEYDARPALSDRQLAALTFIRESISSKGYPPTLREIGDALGIKSTNGVNDHLAALEKKGYIVREAGKSRAIRVLP